MGGWGHSRGCPPHSPYCHPVWVLEMAPSLCPLLPPPRSHYLQAKLSFGDRKYRTVGGERVIDWGGAWKNLLGKKNVLYFELNSDYMDIYICKVLLS